MTRITDPFFKQLYTRLVEELDNRVVSLSENGAAVRGDQGLLLDPFNTAMKYQIDVAVIKAYRDVIELGFEIDRENHGGKANKDNGDY